MIGDQQDMLGRIKAVLPVHWFPQTTPVLDTVLAGAAWAWARVNDLLQEAINQSRLATAQGSWIDLIAWDFFGLALIRKASEGDDAYRMRIRAELIRERGTRRAVTASLLDLTGRLPVLFEPRNTMDTGGYGSGGCAAGLGYGLAGGWGNLDLPFQFFVTAYRPAGVAVALVSGWRCSGGGYCQGALEYATPAMFQRPVTDDDILAAVVAVLPIGTIAWTRIED